MKKLDSKGLVVVGFWLVFGVVCTVVGFIVILRALFAWLTGA